MEDLVKVMDEAAWRMVAAAERIERAMRLYTDVAGMQAENAIRRSNGEALAYSEVEFEKIKLAYYPPKEQK